MNIAELTLGLADRIRMADFDSPVTAIYRKERVHLYHDRSHGQIVVRTVKGGVFRGFLSPQKIDGMISFGALRGA